MTAFDHLQPLQFDLPMRRLFRMRSIDAELEGRGKLVRDILPKKKQEIADNPGYYEALQQSMAEHGQTHPLAIGRDEVTGEDYLVNGAHRIAIGMQMHMKSMKVQRGPEGAMASVDREFDEKHNRRDIWH